MQNGNYYRFIANNNYFLSFLFRDVRRWIASRVALSDFSRRLKLKCIIICPNIIFVLRARIRVNNMN